MARVSVALVVVAVLIACAAGAEGGQLDLRELETSVLQALGNTTRHAVSFARFAHRFRKTYSSVEELKQRFGTFLDNNEKIIAHNKRGLSYTLALNEFADMTWEEFRKHRLGAAQNCSATAKGNFKRTNVSIPERKDWREAGIVSPVKDQGRCGSCWAFSTTGALEAAYTQATGKKILLSEQQLVDCAGAFNNFGCKGGLPSQALEYVMYNGEIASEDEYPYTGMDGVCKSDPKNAVRVTYVYNITTGDEEELQFAVALLRPVSVSFQVIDDFFLYGGGVYASDKCGNRETDVNHSVLGVGYGADELGTRYWIMKNSWGPGWGEEGYFRIELGKNMCGVATCASFPAVAE